MMLTVKRISRRCAKQNCTDVLTATHLLPDHYNKRGECSATVTRDREEFDEAGEVVTLLPEDIGLKLKLSMDIVEVPSYHGSATRANSILRNRTVWLTRLQWRISEFNQRIIGFMITALLKVPTRRFRAEPDAKEKRDYGNESGTKFEPPCILPCSVQRQIGAETEEDTKRDPHLPTHDEPTPNRSRRVFGSEDGHRGRLRPHTNTEQQTADEQLFPGLGEARADDREKTEDGAEEDSTAASEIEIEWIGKPAAAIEKISAGGNSGNGLR
jgi:hypothetical protein